MINKPTRGSKSFKTSPKVIVISVITMPNIPNLTPDLYQ